MELAWKSFVILCATILAPAAAQSMPTTDSYGEETGLTNIIDDACAYNTFMCCWTENELDAVEDNTDVCRVNDLIKFPGESEGDVNCHGFVWAEGADLDSFILPLYHYVRTYDRNRRGYHGHLEDAPECECIEMMPEVSRADCTTFSSQGFVSCEENDLRTHYENEMDGPGGSLDVNLVGQCADESDSFGSISAYEPLERSDDSDSSRSSSEYEPLETTDDNTYSVDIDYASCEYNTYMCCWTENDGGGMEDNTDVCRVHGEMEYPLDSEGEVHCHGFVWPEHRETEDYILPLAHYVQTFDHRDQRGYFGNLPNAPMCGCIEDMPEVSRADCSKKNGNDGGFTQCRDNDLRTQYDKVMDRPRGVLDVNLVGICDNGENAVDVDFASCEYNTYMCCWTENDGNGMEDNTDVCRVRGGMEYPLDSEGEVHCHGFVWPEHREADAYILPLARYVQNFDHRDDRGYFGNLPNAPMCGCIEDMPEVSRADCSKKNGNDGGFTQCRDNDLRTQYDKVMDNPRGVLDVNLVGKCDNGENAVDIDYASCEYNTYMCCWTENDGNGMEDNTDVCRVHGDMEYPLDSEGEVHCHGFVWPERRETEDYILPLARYVQNFDHRDDRGYFGNLPNAPMCGCIEDMPEVSRADCSKKNGNDGGFTQCRDNDLRTQYDKVMDSPRGALDVNLVGTCDNGEDAVDIDYASCEYNTYMCCWTENDGDGMEDNTDVCRVRGLKEYPLESEGKVHCHGFVWPEHRETDDYILPLARYVQNFDHRDDRGYFGNLPGAPMCGCIEDMPEVSRADCSKKNSNDGGFTKCRDNDLRTQYDKVMDSPGGVLDVNLVGTCDNE